MSAWQDGKFEADYITRRGWFIPASAVTEAAAAGLDRLIAKSMHGGSVDAILRVDGIETRHEADWIKYARKVG